MVSDVSVSMLFLGAALGNKWLYVAYDPQTKQTTHEVKPPVETLGLEIFRVAFLGE